jgi:hypothetical protein
VSVPEPVEPVEWPDRVMVQAERPVEEAGQWETQQAAEGRLGWSV